MLCTLLSTVLFVNFCGDETISGYADRTATYRLTHIGDAPFTARATIRFPKEGAATGQAPCNRFNARQTLPYPWFKLDAITTTRRACPDLAAESTYLKALQAMTLAEVQGDILILSNDTGTEMVFRSE